MRPVRAPTACLVALVAAGCVAPAPEADADPGALVVERVVLSSHFIAPGDVVGVEVVLANAGRAEAARAVEVQVDGALFDRAEVALAPGERRGVAFNLALAEPGTHVVEIVGWRFEVVVADPIEIVTSPGPPSGPATLAW